MLFELNEEKNRGEKIEKKSFKDLKMSEVKHLQEIIANNTEALGEELLIIQKEFHGFDDTNERLDLLALDKNGNVVIIENKLDDSGKDVTWQIIKYASYVSALTKDEIIKIFQEYLDRYENNKNSENEMKTFFDVEDLEELVLNEGVTSQRLMLVAGNFRKEITSSVLWLMNYGLKIQCIKATPFKTGEKLILNMEQIIPVKDIEDFTIKISKKEQNEIKVKGELKSRHKIRIEFWKEFIEESNKVSDIYSTRTGTKGYYLTTPISKGVRISSVVSRNLVDAEIFFGSKDKEKNKQIFDILFRNKKFFEEKSGLKLVWDRMDDFTGSKIYIRYDGGSDIYNNKELWGDTIKFLIKNINKLKQVFEKEIENILS